MTGRDTPPPLLDHARRLPCGRRRWWMWKRTDSRGPWDDEDWRDHDRRTMAYAGPRHRAEYKRVQMFDATWKEW